MFYWKFTLRYFLEECAENYWHIFDFPRWIFTYCTQILGTTRIQLTGFIFDSLWDFNIFLQQYFLGRFLKVIWLAFLIVPGEIHPTVYNGLWNPLESVLKYSQKPPKLMLAIFLTISSKNCLAKISSRVDPYRRP